MTAVLSLRRPRRLRAPAVVAAAGAAFLILGPAAPAGAQEPDDEGAARVTDLEFRVVDLEYRSASLDGASTTEQTPDRTSVALAADVLFEFDSAALSPAAQAQLAAVADDLSALGPRDVAVDGHTDSVGDDAYNQTLSAERAESVRTALAATLGSGFTFTVTGHGEAQPVAPNANEDGSDDPAGRAANRRVVITYPSD